MKILMLKGLPGSGKSTWAKQFVSENRDFVRINRDSIRSMIGYQRSDEGLVCRFRDILVIGALSNKKSVVVDDTNLNPVHEKRLRYIAETYGVEFEIRVFETSIDECVKNDLQRLESVGERVIRKMHEKYIRPSITQRYPQDKTLPKAIICDLDGTLAHANHRDIYDASTCDQDDIDEAVQKLILRYSACGYEILFTSGRDAAYRSQTEKFLSRIGLTKPCMLFMRPEGDRRKDYVVKLELYEQNIMGRYYVEFALDDRQQVVDMWRNIGLTVLQVAEGNF